jgi:hypothetical protein
MLFADIFMKRIAIIPLSGLLFLAGALNGDPASDFLKLPFR